MAKVEEALTEVLMNHSDAVATAVMRWLVSGARPVHMDRIDFGWPPLGVTYPFP
jgi:hypothetical protein